MSKKTKKPTVLILEDLAISEVEHSIDYCFGIEVIPTECYTLSYYDKDGEYHVFEKDRILN